MNLKIYALLALGLLLGCYTQARMGQNSENQVNNQETLQKGYKIPVETPSEAFVIEGAYITLQATQKVKNIGLTGPYMKPMTLSYNPKTQKFEPKPVANLKSL